MTTHNPQGIKPEKIPAGWRLLFDTELKHPPLDAMMYTTDGDVPIDRYTVPGNECSQNKTYITRASSPVQKFNPEQYPQFRSIATAISNASTQPQ